MNFFKVGGFTPDAPLSDCGCGGPCCDEAKAQSGFPATMADGPLDALKEWAEKQGKDVGGKFTDPVKKGVIDGVKEGGTQLVQENPVKVGTVIAGAVIVGIAAAISIFGVGYAVGENA